MALMAASPADPFFYRSQIPVLVFLHGIVYVDYAAAEIAKKLKMNASGMKWISHAQKNPFVSNMLLPKNHPKKLDNSTPSRPAGTP